MELIDRAKWLRYELADTVFHSPKKEMLEVTDEIIAFLEKYNSYLGKLREDS